MFLFTTPASPEAMRAPRHGQALAAAARATGVSFSYLAETARRESGFRADAQASTSSARGLYQFVTQTWLRTMRAEGAAIGLGREAAAISVDSSGRAAVADPAMRAHILNLRDHPAISARLAAALARDNAAHLTAKLGRAPSDGELYVAHFLGAAGAARLIAAKDGAAGTAAASLFPSAAAANRTIFYDPAGQARSVAAVYDRLVRGFAPEAATAVAQAVPDAHPFFSLFRSGATTPAPAQAASFWRAPAKPAAPLDLNAFRIRSSHA